MEKIIELIKKLLGQSSSSDSSENKGFTLIELLIVIAIIGILAAATLVALDPIDKINAGNDTRVQTSIKSMYDAAIRYYSNNGTMPSQTQLTDSGELKSVPVSPYGGGAYTYVPSTDDVMVCGVVKSKAQRVKANGVAGTPAANGVMIFSNSKVCYQAVATCPATYYACP